MPDDVARRRSLLTTALVGALLPADVPEGRLMRAWLDNWEGVGHVVDAMHEQAYKVRLMQSSFAGGQSSFETGRRVASVGRPKPRRGTLAGRAAGRLGDAGAGRHDAREGGHARREIPT
jgi:hypothetical protein